MPYENTCLVFPVGWNDNINIIKNKLKNTGIFKIYLVLPTIFDK